MIVFCLGNDLIFKSILACCEYSYFKREFFHWQLTTDFFLKIFKFKKRIHNWLARSVLTLAKISALKSLVCFEYLLALWKTMGQSMFRIKSAVWIKCVQKENNWYGQEGMLQWPKIFGYGSLLFVCLFERTAKKMQIKPVTSKY